MSSLLERRRRSSFSLGIKANRTSFSELPNFRRIKKLEDGQKIFDLYSWKEVLQETGDGGKVVVCRPKTDGASPKSPDVPSDVQYVMKIRSKKQLHENALEETFRKVQERTLNLPPHEGVIHIVDVLEDEAFYYVVMEKATGGSFFEGLLNEFKTGIIPSREVKRLTIEILKAVGHLHSQGILHRDIKPDNFVMHLRAEPGSPTGYAVSPKLVDFDHAHPDWDEAGDRQQGGRWGTLIFNAPETFLSQCSEQSDLYSVGAVLYLLMSGKMPYPEHLFAEGTMEDMYHAMKRFEVDWQCDPWPDQPLCKDLCYRLLAFKEDQRMPNWEEAVQHHWFDEE